MESITDIKRRAMQGPLLSLLSEHVHESPGATKRAVESAIPLSIAGLAAQVSSERSAADLLGTLRGGNYPHADPGMLAQAAADPMLTSQLAESGGGVISKMFGNNLDDVVSSVAGHSGVSKPAAMTLLGLAAPMVLDAVGKEADARHLDARGLWGYLTTEGRKAARTLPEPVSGMLGKLGNGGGKLAAMMGAGAAGMAALGSRAHGARDRTQLRAHQAYDGLRERAHGMLGHTEQRVRAGTQRARGGIERGHEDIERARERGIEDIERARERGREDIEHARSRARGAMLDAREQARVRTERLREGRSEAPVIPTKRRHHVGAWIAAAILAVLGLLFVVRRVDRMPSVPVPADPDMPSVTAAEQAAEQEPPPAQEPPTEPPGQETQAAPEAPPPAPAADMQGMPQETQPPAQELQPPTPPEQQVAPPAAPEMQAPEQQAAPPAQEMQPPEQQAAPPTQETQPPEQQTQPPTQDMQEAPPGGQQMQGPEQSAQPPEQQPPEQQPTEPEPGATAEAGMPDSELQTLSPKTGLAPLNAVLTGDTPLPARFNLEGVKFASNSAKLKGGGTLAGVARQLNAHPDAQIRIDGHTSAEGSAERNQALSQERADSVKQYLTEHGIAAERIETQGLADQQPLAANESSADRAKNRRVELVLLSR